MHRRIHLWLAVAVGIGVLGAEASTARACSCAGPGGPPVVVPTGAIVPPNVRFWVLRPPAGLFELRNEAGEEVAFTSSILEVGGLGTDQRMGVLTPDEPLAPGRYELGSAQPDGTSALLGRYMVEGAEDHEPPMVPEVVSSEGVLQEEEGSSCGKYRGVSAEITGGDLIVLRLSSSPSTLELDPPSGQVFDLFVSRDGMAGFGYSDGPCSSVWPADGDRVSFELASFDVAGNFSGWSKTQTLTRPEYSGCSVRPGHAQAPSVLATVLGFVGLAALARRKRQAAR